MSKSLWGRLFRSYLLVVLLTVGVSGLLVTFLVENVVVEQRLRELSRRANQLAVGFAVDIAGNGLDARPWGILRQVVAEEFWIVNGEGVIVASSVPMAALVGRQLPEDEWRTLQRGERIVLRRRAHRLLQEPFLLVGIPVIRRGVTIGAIFTHSPLSGIREAMAEVRRIIALSGLSGIVGALGVSYWLSKGMAAPLRVLGKATSRLARGDFTGRIPPTGIAELDALGAGFDSLSQDLALAVAQLEQEKEQAHGILQNMSEGVVLFGKDGTVLHLNRVAEDFFGDSQHALELTRVLQKVWASHTGEQVEEEITAGERTFLVRASALSSQDEVWGAVAVLIDISSRRQLENARSEFVAVVSHELRTPLAHIQGYIEAILDGVARDEKTKEEYLRVALGETLRLGRISQDLLTLAQTDAGTLRLSKMELPLANFVEDVTHPWRLLAEKMGVPFVETVEASGTLLADPDRLKQILDNLLENAFAHTTKGQEVSVSVKEDGLSVSIAVADSGCGIPADAITHIWERFYRVDSSRSRQKGGSGLGLAIVKELVELHNGTITVESEKGLGTRFIMTLPKSDM